MDLKNIIERSVLLNVIYRVNTLSIKTSMTFFQELEKKILKFIWKQKNLTNSQSNFDKKSKAGGITIPDFKTEPFLQHQHSTGIPGTKTVT
jgi:hypothetical protein